MSGNIGRVFNRLLTATMLVIVLIACERMPENQTIEQQQNHSQINNYR